MKRRAKWKSNSQSVCAKNVMGMAGVKRWVHEATLDKFARLVIVEVVETRRAGASRAPARLFTHDPAYLFLAVGHHDY
jgi:hypothetical protein